jgi:ABC-type amino acid transport substrate-binding protein
MKIALAMLLTVGLVGGAAAALSEECDVPASFHFADSDLSHVAAAVKARHSLDIAVIGSGSSTLTGPDGERSAYPARLVEALKRHLPGVEVRVFAHVKARQTAGEMDLTMDKILADEKPALVVWQTGTNDAIRGVDPDVFRAKLDEGVEKLQAGGADVILMNMQYSPRTESILDVAVYADVMRWVAQQRGAVLFDRQALMRYWNEVGAFDLYSATRDYAMARKVHDCIARALASQILGAAHLDALKKQTTR